MLNRPRCFYIHSEMSSDSEARKPGLALHQVKLSPPEVQTQSHGQLCPQGPFAELKQLQTVGMQQRLKTDLLSSSDVH